MDYFGEISRPPVPIVPSSASDKRSNPADHWFDKGAEQTAAQRIGYSAGAPPHRGHVGLLRNLKGHNVAARGAL